MEWTAEDLEQLRRARRLLESEGLAVRLAEVLGVPLERGLQMLPRGWHRVLQSAVNRALEAALGAAVVSLGDPTPRPSRESLHKLAVLATGAGGGAFGLAGLIVELPISTTIMLRSIADIARSEGEDLSLLETRLECLKVFALGGPAPGDAAAETGYFAVRSALAGTVRDAAQFISRQGLTEKGAPVLVRLITAIGSRFGVVVSEKAAAMAVPALGAAGGALVNTLFMSHFQDVARGHFTVRRLERRYGREAVEEAYGSLLPPAAPGGQAD
jgi:hypothetical protein